MTTLDTPAAVDISTLKKQLQELQKCHESGAMTNELYQTEKAQLERQLLDAVLCDKPADATDMTDVTPAKSDAPAPSSRLLLVLACVVLLVAVAGYAWVGRATFWPSKGSIDMVGSGATPESVAPGNPPHATNMDQIAAMAESLAVKLKANPQDAEGWAMLARTYSVLTQNTEALNAYEKAIALRANDAVLLADYADALAFKNNRSLIGEPMKVVERALKIDPLNIKALSLAGTHAFEKKDYASAVKFWEQVVQFGAADTSLVEQVQPGLTEARALAGLPPASKITVQPIKPVADIAGLTVSGTVTLTSALARMAKPEDTVFIFARPAEGSRMPLAIIRKQVKDLPIQFTLDDSMAMSPASRLSQAGRVLVGARISKSGNAIPEKGDLAGQSAPVAVGIKGLVVEIKETVQ
jgi:cytochrome c-type biogenesis protein CcmH